MSKIKAELVKATGLSAKRGESEEDFQERLFRATADLGDKEWEALSTDAQVYHNDYADALNEDKPLPGFPDAEKEEAPASSRRTTTKAAPKKDEPAEPQLEDEVIIVTKRGATKQGIVVEIDSKIIVIKSEDGEEEELARDRLESIQVKQVEEEEAPAPTTGRRRAVAEPEEEAPAVEEPKEGDTITAETARGKAYAGKVVELGDDLVVIDDGKEEIELVPSKLKFLKIDAPKATGRRKAAEEEAPAATGRKSAAKPAEDGERKKVTKAENGGVSATVRMRELICEDFDITKDELAKVLKKEGITYRDNTLDLVFADTNKVIGILKGLKKVK